MTTFMVNGEEKTLELRDGNGIDWSADFIGNTSHGMDHDEEGNYIAFEEEFEWWENTIEQWETMESIIVDYKNRFDRDEVDKVVSDHMGGYDLEYQPRNVIAGLKEVFGELS